MACDTVRQFLLETGWDADGRRSAAQFLDHAETCDACRAALQDYDALRATFPSAGAEPPEPDGGWEALEDRLANSLPRRQHPHFRAALAIAASVLVAAGVFQAGRYIATPPGTTPFAQKTPSTSPAPVSIAPRDMSRDVREFREVSERAFDGRASWMVLSHGDSDVGVASDPLPLTRKVLMLRLALWRGAESISNSDLIVVAGQKADLTLPLSAGQSLHYRIGTSTDEPTHLTVFLELKTPRGGEPLAALATTLKLRPGESLTAGRLTTSAGEYELKLEFSSTDVSDNKP